MVPENRVEVCIIGAGITGLSLGYLLQKQGMDVLLLEKQNQPGGVIRSEKFAGFLFEHGPNSTLATSPNLAKLIEEIGLKENQCFANPSASNRFILRGQKLRLVPMDPKALLKSNLLSVLGKLRVLGELFVGKNSSADHETVAEFVRRRLGQEFLDYVINPFVAGVYAGDPKQLSMKAAFYRVFDLEQQYGGLIRGAIAKQRERKKSGSVDRTKANLFSFDQGMQVLPLALADKLRQSICFGIHVLQIKPADSGFLIYGEQDRKEPVEIHARQVILSSPAYSSADLIAPFAPIASRKLKEIPYAPVAIVFHGYFKKSIQNNLAGFGFLVPEKEERKILGCIWNSSLFPNRAPDGHAGLTTFVGGSRQPELASLDDAELDKLVQIELKFLLGLSAKPVVTKIQRQAKAIPQYVRGHERRIAAIETLEKAYPGLYIVGNFRGGISVSDCVEHAFKMARKITKNSAEKPVQVPFP